MNYVIVGGGISGLVAAHALIEAKSDSNITLIEKEQELGGLLSGVVYTNSDLYFDTGTHIFQETGIESLDQLLLKSVPHSELLHFPVGSGDVCGTVFNQRLQSNSHFPDLRDVFHNRISHSVSKHIKSVKQIQPIHPCDNLFAASSSRFGENFTKEIVAPVFEHTFGVNINSLSAFSLFLTGWTRVILDEEKEWLSRSNDSLYRSLVGIPDQRNLPLSLHHGRRSFYSKSMGSKAFVCGLVTSLMQSGVKILNGNLISSFDADSLTFSIKSSTYNNKILKADKVIFSNGVMGAAKILDVNLNNFGFEKPIQHKVIDVLLKEQCESDLCYLLGLDVSCDWYRVTNYSAITGDNTDRRLTIEVLGDRNDHAQNLAHVCLNQLKDISFLQSSEVEFCNIRELKSGFPTPSVQNFCSINRLWSHLDTTLPGNIMVSGIGSNNGLFFQNEIILDIYNRTLNFV